MRKERSRGSEEKAEAAGRVEEEEVARSASSNKPVVDVDRSGWELRFGRERSAIPPTPEEDGVAPVEVFE